MIICYLILFYYFKWFWKVKWYIYFFIIFFYDILLVNVGKINCNILDNEKIFVFFCLVLVFFEMKKIRFFFYLSVLYVEFVN